MAATRRATQTSSLMQWSPHQTQTGCLPELPLLLAGVAIPKGPQPGQRRTSQQPAQPKGSCLLDSIPQVTATVMGAGVTQGRINTKDMQQDRGQAGRWAAEFCWSTQRTSVA